MLSKLSKKDQFGVSWVPIFYSQKDSSGVTKVPLCKESHVRRYFIVVLLIDRTVLRGTTSSDWSKYPCHLRALKVVVHLRD